jgi:hypothetical protein
LAALRHRIQIEQVRLAEINLMKDFCEILPPAGGKIVNPAHFVALRQHGASERRPDKPRNPRDEISSHAVILANELQKRRKRAIWIGVRWIQINT